MGDFQADERNFNKSSFGKAFSRYEYSPNNMMVSAKNTAKTVTEAFRTFRENSVDLGAAETEKARASRDFLLQQLRELCGENSDLPKVKSCNLFGSFARRTKVRPLDDIDLMVVFEREGISFSPGSYILKQAAPYLSIKGKNSPFKSFEDQSEYVSSTKVLDRIVASLRYVSNYQKAEIKRDQEAAVLNLSSYTWKFDIVPAFEFPNLLNDDTACYVIPDGHGKWMKTDPRIDAEAIAWLNQKFDRKFLSFLRLLKCWNNFDLNKPKLNSYYFETLAKIVFGNRTPQIKTYPEAVRYFFKHVRSHLINHCPDPKGYGPALDSGLEPAIKKRVKDEISEALFLCEKAIQYEEKPRHREAILLWHIIFGPEFPTYG